jgi:hypothetical protein
VAVGGSRYDLKLVRSSGRTVIVIARRDDPTPGPAPKVVVAPSFPLDATVRSVTVNGQAARFQLRRAGDVQRAEVTIEGGPPTAEIVFAYAEGTDVTSRAEAPAPGARSEGLRILRARAEAGGLHLRLEGRGGREYPLHVRTPRTVGGAPGVTLTKAGPGDWDLRVSFEGPTETYVRRDLVLLLR